MRPSGNLYSRFWWREEEVMLADTSVTLWQADNRVWWWFRTSDIRNIAWTPHAFVRWVEHLPYPTDANWGPFQSSLDAVRAAYADLRGWSTIYEDCDPAEIVFLRDERLAAGRLA
jgi:hypothetical protein